MCDVMENQHRNLALGGVRNYSIWRRKIVTVIRTEACLQYLVVVVGGVMKTEAMATTANQLFVCLFVYLFIYMLTA